MPFIPDDLYLASGTDYLINSYTDPVYKFDSSSFYNWENDNLPIYDLEERDDLLFEMAGYPTSSVPGMMLTVSCCGIDNRKVFGTIEDAVKALPNTIRFPIIIEVAASGQLGEMRLENLQFEGSGAGLEIVNRGFAKVLCGSGSPSSTLTTIDSGSSGITAFTSEDLSSTMVDSSSLGVSATVWELGTTYDYWNDFTRTFAITPEWSRTDNASVGTTSVSSRYIDPGAGSSWISLLAANEFALTQYTDNSTSVSDKVITKHTGAVVNRDDLVVGTDVRVTGFTYANALSNAVIRNCAGRVFIRGFCVDGMDSSVITSTGTQRTKVGFSVNNSDVVFENCTATRCSEAGMDVRNSNVVLSRGFIAYRNYELTTTTSNLDTRGSYSTPGLLSTNSVVTLSGSVEEDKGLPIDSPFCFSRNQVGIELVNSKLLTPPKFEYSKDVSGTSITNNFGSQTMVLQSFFNVEEGIKATGSTVDFSQRIATFQNDIGVRLIGSEFKVAEFISDHNQEEGLVAKGSTFVYNKDSKGTSVNGPFYPQTYFLENGQHVNMVGSEFITPYVPGAMVAQTKRVHFKENFKVLDRLSTGTATGYDTVPAVALDGSMMDLIASRMQCYDMEAAGTTLEADSFRKGLGYFVNNQSTLMLTGHQLDHTVILGPYDSNKQQNSAGVYAGNQSSVRISGPTHIGQFGIDCLAEDNSTIEFGPHTKDGVIDAVSYNLTSNVAHTKVELHATRACIVANRGSTIEMKDMGDFQTRWDSKYQDDLDLSPSDTGSAGFGNSQKYSPYTASGFMSFYPNPYAEYGTGGNKINLEAQAHPSHVNVTLANESDRSPDFFAETAGNILDMSWGGHCVRAIQDSNVSVQNVEFLCDWTNTSGAYYDVSATECELLRIWNIADSSKLTASYMSVNGQHPQDSSSVYYGPSACWNDGVDALSGCPYTTPDTSSFSTLDSFGLGYQTNGALGYYGETTHKNIGPFRLYVSPDPKAKFLGFPIDSLGGVYIPPVYPATFISMGFDFDQAATLQTGVPYQVLSQGYNCSGDCSASPLDTVSSIYQELAFSAYITSLPEAEQVQNVASSFFYAEDMLSDTSKNIWLDESAMNSFANAKNGTLNTSGRKAFLSHYMPNTVYPGEASWDNDKGVGFGSASLFDTDRNI